MIFAGEFRERIDAQGRIAVPDPFRPSFAGGIVLARGFERCITVFTPAAWQRVGEDLGRLSLTRASTRLARFTFSGAQPGEVDRQGRLSLPDGLMQYAGLSGSGSGSAVVVGVGAVVELWAPEAWETERRALLEEARDLIVSPEPSPGAQPDDAPDA